MFKTFSTGIILGLIAAGAAAHFLPLYDLHREASIVTVRPNGGIAELFQIHLPADRILAGGRNLPDPVPDRLAWPEALDSSAMELFKIRNANDRVVGIASRIQGAVPQTPEVVEWMLHLPARGSMYIAMANDSGVEGNRTGSLQKGTREFAGKHGTIRETFVPSGSDDSSTGRIELLVFVVANAVDEAEEVVQ
ncbi:MAG: hypothetical protein WD672_08050 [Woeseia sp.]